MNTERNNIKLIDVILVHYLKVKNFYIEYEKYSKSLGINDHPQFLYFSEKYAPYIAYRINKDFLTDKGKFYD